MRNNFRFWSKGAKLLKCAQDVFTKSSENSLEIPKGCLSCSRRIGDHFQPTWEQKTFFFEKNRIFFRKCRIVPKNVKGTCSHSVAKYHKKTRRGTLWRHENFRRKSYSSEEKSKGRPLVSSGFVSYVKKINNERGTLSTKFPLAGLDFSSFSSFCKKCTFQCEICSLKKKRSL